MSSKIVFVHAPKCGGRSLIEGVVQAIGPDAVYMDYGNNPANPGSDHRIDPVGSARRFAADAAALDGVRIAYGHLHPAKYRAIWPDARWMTVLRHPVDRIISHYYFWNEDRRYTSHPIRDYMRRNKLSLLEFAELPFSRAYYQSIFSDGIDRSCFTFVGRSENSEAATDILGHALDATIPVLSLNTGIARRQDNNQDEIAEARGKLHGLLADEIDFYETWTA